MAEQATTTEDATTTTTTEGAPASEAATTTAPEGSSTDKTVTFSQEKLDRIIASRVAEERSKFSDYDDLKAARDELATLKQANESESERVQRERDEAKAEADRNAQTVAEKDAENLRLRVALETKLPAELIDRLRGDTEDAIREDAAKLLELVKPGSAPSFDGGARKPTDDGKTWTRDEVRALVRSDPEKFNALVESGDIPTDALA